MVFLAPAILVPPGLCFPSSLNASLFGRFLLPLPRHRPRLVWLAPRLVTAFRDLADGPCGPVKGRFGLHLLKSRYGRSILDLGDHSTPQHVAYARKASELLVRASLCYVQHTCLFLPGRPG